MLNITTMPEPPDDTVLVVKDSRDNWAVVRRSDQAAQGRSPHKDERWFYNTDNDWPLSWKAVVECSKTVHAVDPEPVAGRQK